MYTIVKLINGVDFQDVKCEWTLDALLHRYENKYNVEINQNGRFCCCDTTICEMKLENLPTNCSESCDTSFNVSIAPCNSREHMPCFTQSTKSGFNRNVPFFVEYNYFFHLTSEAQPENVSNFVKSLFRILA